MLVKYFKERKDQSQTACKLLSVTYNVFLHKKKWKSHINAEHSLSLYVKEIFKVYKLKHSKYEVYYCDFDL